MSAVQASSIYIIMRFLDPSIQESTHALQMLLYFQVSLSYHKISS
jgi:hypothetical protein